MFFTLHLSSQFHSDHIRLSHFHHIASSLLSSSRTIGLTSSSFSISQKREFLRKHKRIFEHESRYSLILLSDDRVDFPRAVLKSQCNFCLFLAQFFTPPFAPVFILTWLTTFLHRHRANSYSNFLCAMMNTATKIHLKLRARIRVRVWIRWLSATYSSIV